MPALTYQEQCTKHFAPLDEISEALMNGEGCGAIQDSHMLLYTAQANHNLRRDLIEYEDERWEGGISRLLGGA